MDASLLFVGIIGAVCAVAWYYVRIVAPYSKFPSYRLDVRIIYWLLKGQPVRINFLKELLKISRQNAKEGMAVLWIGNPWVLVYGKEAARMFLSHPAALDRPRVYEVFRRCVGNSILISNGDEWKKLKRVLHPAFQLVALKDKVSVMNEHSRQLVKTLADFRNNTTEETQNIMRDSAFQVFLESSLGIVDNNSLNYHRISEIIDTITGFLAERMIKPWLQSDFVLNIFSNTREKLKVIDEGQGLVKKVVEQMKHIQLTSPKLSTETFGQRPKLFSEILIKEHLKDPSFTMNDLHDQTIFLLAAAHDTTAVSLMMAFYLLGVHQEVQEQAYQEVISVVKGSDVRFEELQELKYLDCVIKETQRMFPVVPIVGRCVNKDVQCGEYTVPKGSTIFIDIQAVHSNPEIFPDPDRFDPERFRTNTPRDFVPFAEGLRACPGKTYSYMLMKIIVAHVLRNFKVVSLDRREDFELGFELVLSVSKPLRMQFQSRHTLITT